uniref:Phospholipid-transporting ATPase n=1 Tax=Guillardia theta (strain CCMP2712) TaxID=905079 RepID=A0A0C3SL24_GUITC
MREVECPPDPHKHFESNYVKTNKYTIVTFLPLNLFLQFHRLANCYFLVIAILASTPLSPVTGTTYWFPLISVLAISAIKDASEDYRRYKSDIEENSRVTEVFNWDRGDFEQVPWKQVAVGSIVRVKTGDDDCPPMVPADLSLLCTSSVDGTCFLETANLDGETNLKIREAPEALHKHLVGEPHQVDGHSVDCNLAKLKTLKVKVNCHIPDALLYDFNARIEWEGQDIPLTGGASGGQFMQRSTKLKNTKWCIGLAVYTGKETKIQMNMTDPPNKVSNIERKLNVYIIGILAILGILCLVGAIGAGTMNNSSELKGAWYLSPQNTSISFNVQKPGTTGFLSFFSFLILLSLLVPISLYVSVEMVKLVISILISSDREMYAEEDDIPSKARSLGLCEELGQINYIFSDKTGTLTQNLMEFKKCSIAGVEYGQGYCEVERAIARRQGRDLPDDPLPPPGEKEWSRCKDDCFLALSGKWRESQDRKIIEDFLFNMAVNHNAQVEYNEGSDIPAYQAESPDEGAFVQAARNLGKFFFCRRNMKDIHIKTSDGPVGQGVEKKWTVLNFNAFDNNRKRTSVVISDETKSNILLLIKGADTSVMPFIDVNACPYYKSTQQQVDKFGEQGLRTLVFAGRVLEPEYYSAWNDRFKKASLLSDGREKALRQVTLVLYTSASLVSTPRSLTLHGVTALEDKLQENVGECISQLAKAMIKIWVLTGDKLETAINIGFATALLTQEMEPLNRISQDDMLSDDPGWSKDAIESKLKDALLKERVKRKIIELSKLTQTPKPGGWALVIDGTCLRAAATPELKILFLEASVRCKAVVCCRVTPSQKAQMTLLVKDNIPGQITLAIGDGANDVSMIQAAHIGIGIRGKEGQQAVLASDYALPRFAYLERLLLIHGRWSYNRIGTMVCYFFYKNISYAFTLFWFSLNNAFSAQPLYDDGYQALYNLVFTSLPVMFFAVLDRDLHPSVVRAHPELYSAGHFNVRFSLARFSMFIVGAIVHATVLYFVTLEMLDLNTYGSSGRNQDLWGAGTTVLTNVIWTVTIVMGLHTRSWTWMHWFVYVGSILVWYLFLVSYNGFPPESLGSWDTQDNVYDVIYELGKGFLFWLSSIVTVSMCTLPILFYKYCKEQYFPNIDDYYRRVVKNPSLYPAEHLPSTSNLDIKICQPHERNFGSREYSPEAAREATRVEEVEDEPAGVQMEARRGPPQTPSGGGRPNKIKKDSQGILEVQSSSP